MYLYFSALRVTAVFGSGRDEAGAGDALHLDGNGGDCFFSVYIHDDLSRQPNQPYRKNLTKQRGKNRGYIPSQ